MAVDDQQQQPTAADQLRAHLEQMRNIGTPTPAPPVQPAPSPVAGVSLPTPDATQPDVTMDRTRAAIARIEGGPIAGLIRPTFDDYNRRVYGGKLDWSSREDRQTVNNRVFDDLTKAATDPNTGQVDHDRIAVGYFSGPGNIAPPGSPTPYKHDWYDSNHMSTSGYVSRFRQFRDEYKPSDTGDPAAYDASAVTGKVLPKPAEQLTAAQQMEASLAAYRQAQGTTPEAAGSSPGFVGGFKAGLTDFRQAGLALHALGDKLFGDSQGATDLMTTFQTLEQKKAAQTKFHSIQELYDKGSVGDVLNYVLYNLGEQVPNLALMLTGGGVAGFLGKKLGVMVAEGMIDETAANALISKFGSRAALVGAYSAATLGQTIPAVTGEQFQATGDLAHPFQAIGMGALAGVPAAFTPMHVAGLFGMPEVLAAELPNALRSRIALSLGDGWLARRASGALVYGAEAGVGAGLQQAVQDAARSFVDQNFQFLGPESRSRILNAAANGTLLGSVFGSISPAHHLDDYVANKWLGELGVPGFDKNVKSPSKFTPTTDPRIDKALPFGDNPSYNVVQQVFREALVNSGGWDRLNPRQQQYLLDNPHTMESLELVMPQVRQELKRDMEGKTIKDDNGVDFTPNKVDPDFQTQTVKAIDEKTGQTRTMPMADAPLREAAIRAIDTMNGKDGKPIPFFRLIPEGYVHGKFADIDVGIVHQHAASPAYFDAYRHTGTVTDSAGKPVDISAGLPKGKVIFAQDKAVTTSDMTPRSMLDNKQMRRIEAVIKRYAKDATVLIDTHRFATPGNFNPATSSFRNVGNKTYMIHLKEEQMVHATQYHEIGHLVAWHHFADASLAQKLVLYTAYRNELRDFSGNDLMDLAARASKPGSLLLYKEFGGVDATNFKTWFDFDEWMAEGFARAMLDQHAKLTDRYFDGVASKVTDALKDLGVDLTTLKPHQFLGDWFDGLYKNEPVGMGMIASDVMKSSAENARATGTRLNPGDTFGDMIAKSPPDAPQNMHLDTAVAKGMITKAAKAQADKFSWFTRWMWNTMQVAILNPHIEPLNRASNLFQAFHADRMGTMIGADGILKAHRKLGKEMGKVLTNVLFAMDRRDYQKPEEAPRWPTRDEFKELIRKNGGTTETWRQIDPVYQQYRKTFSGIVDRMEASLMEGAKEITDPTSRAMRINNISYEMSALRARPYFPHSRYGDYAVLIRDSKGQKMHFEMFHTQRQAQAATKELEARYRTIDPGATARPSKIPNDLRQWFGLPPQMLDRIREMPEITPEQHDWLDNFRFEMSPENSFSKHFMARTGLPGYDMNAMRSFANYMSSASGHMARLKYRGQIDQAVKDLYTTANSFTDLKENSKRTEMADWLRREAEYVMHPPNEAAGMRAFAFQWYLGFNPSTAFVHLMQMPMFTAPYMSKIYGAGSVLRMLSSYRDMSLGLTDPTKLTLEPRFMAQLQRAFHDGFMSENRGVDMANWAQFNLMQRALSGTNVQRNISSVLNATGQIMRTVEKSNRLVTFRAAWKEAMADPANKHVQKLVLQNEGLFRQLLGEGESPQTAAAYIAARDAVQQTHFSYTQVARPRWQRGKLSPFTTFMMYKQQALWFFFHNPAGMRALATLTAVSGVTGLPFEQDASDIVKWISEKFFGTRWDPNEELQKHLAELMDHPETIMHGFGSSGMGMPTLFGALGIPVQFGDMSRRLGYGELLPGVAEWTRDQQEGFMERFGNAAAQTLGATLEVPIQAGAVLSNLNPQYVIQRLLEGGLNWETIRGFEPVMPAVFRNLEQAGRLIAQGGDVGPTGGMKTPLDFNDAEGWTAAMSRAFGFTPEDIARTGRVQDTIAQVGNYWKIRKATAMQQFVQARMMRDPQAMADTSEAIKRFNQEAPSAKMKIHAQGLIEAIKRQATKNALMPQGLGQDPQLARSILPSYPEYQQQLQSTGIQSSLPQ